MSPGNSLDCLKPTIATGQERHPPLTQHGYNKDVIAIGDAKNPKDLWLQAYESLELREPDLVAAYKCRLTPTSTNSADPEFPDNYIYSLLQNNRELLNLSQR